jgi:subtilisin-like proprotein convertase family protein
MKKISFLLVLQTFFYFNSIGQNQSNFFADIPENTNLGTPQIQAVKSRLVQVDLNNLKNYLKSVPLEFTPKATSTVNTFFLPAPDGTTHEFDLEESPMMEPGLAAKYPDFKTYTAKGITDPSANAKISITPKGFHAMVRSVNGTYFVDPYTTLPTNNCIVYYKQDYNPNGKAMSCLVDDIANSKMDLQGVFKNEEADKIKETDAPESFFGDCQRRDFRLAMAATGEYTVFHGGTVPLALAAIVVSVNRINGVYEEEFGVHFNLIANNNLIIYTNGATDPYTNSSGSTMLNENQTNINTVIGSANYDVGHVFSTGGGGIAQLNSPCGTGKARGVTGSGAPVGDPFDIDYVAHEMGHQFGGNHTQNNNCNRALAVECGSGVTIMGYAGICAPNVASNSIDIFHSSNLIEITNFLVSASASCRTIVPIPNSTPTISSSSGNRTIPVSTPFALTSVASDVDGDILTYNWDQFDNQVSTQPPVATNTGGPNFRCFLSTTNPTWYFPSLPVLASNVADQWQVLPSVARTMNFRLTVRDNHPGNGCTSSATSTITFDATSGPFALSSPTNTGISYSGLSSQTITWNVANTTAAPVSCSNVDILLSTDGGLTYPTVLLTATPNDGSQNVTIPNTPTSTARIMVRANGNIFFDISNNNFAITAPVMQDYTISATPSSQSVCINNAASYTVATTSILGYTDPITLSATGLPGGASATFSPNPVTPGNNSTLTINGLNTGSNSSITINATSTSGNKSDVVTLNVIPNLGAFSLTAPANAATGVSGMTSFSWTAATGASSYDLQISTDAGFTSVQNITGITTNSHTLTTSLNSSTLYFWRVRAVNSCFTGSYTSGFSFTTNNVFCTTFNSTNVPLTISASGTPEVLSNLAIPFTGTITDINLVNVTGTHSWISDLTFTLRSPGLVDAIVLQNICTNQDNFNINFDDEATNAYASIPCPPTSALNYQPKNLLSIYDGTALNGNWILSVKDAANQDGGTLVSWGLNVCYSPICNLLATVTPVNTSCPVVCDGSASVSFTNGIAPYTYAWSNSQTTPTATALCVQSYSLSASDAQGCTVSSNFSVGSVGALPLQPGAFTSSTASVCPGTTGVQYTVPSVAGVSYAWTYSGNGATINGTGNSITIDFSLLATSGTLTVTPSNSCGPGPTRQMSVTLQTLLTWYLDFDMDGYYVGTPVSACVSPGAGYTSTLPINGFGDCNDADINVHAVPTASTITAGGPVTFCSGGSVVLSGNTAGGVWNTSQTTVSIFVTTSGSYFVTNSNSCGSVNSNTITVNASAASIPPYAPTNVAPYVYGFEDATPPAVFCGLVVSNDNFPADAEQWETSTLAPRAGNNHMAIEANSDGLTNKNDWFFTAPLTLSAGVLYRLSFWYRATNASKIEQMEIYAGNTSSSFDMLLGSPIYTKNTINNLSYVNDSAADFLAPTTGTYYFGFYAKSAANQASLYVDDIKVRPLTSTNLTTTSCNSTLVSMYDPIYIYPIPGATNYQYKLENLSQSFSSSFIRNSSNPDFRMKWAPGVQYGTTYDVSVSAYANGVWGPYGASCQIAIGAFPLTKLVTSSCNISITDLNTPIYCDTIPGANNYEYRIVNVSQGYDHTWYRNLPLNDYRLAWAQSSTVSGLQFGFTYDIQVRALVGKTATLPGTWGTFGTVCQVTLAGGIPQTQLIPLHCGSSLLTFTQAFNCIPVSGATDYQYRVNNATLGYSQTGTRTNSNTNYQLNWLPSAGGGIRYATTYNVEVRAKVGGVWGNYGSICQITTPVSPLTSLQAAYCPFTLPTFSTQVFCTAVAGATNYRYHITGPGGYDKTFTRNTSANDWRFSWTVLCCGQQNMLPNTTYSVEVASYAGGVWSSYGAACNITTSPTIPRYAILDSEASEEIATDLEMRFYPNPAFLNDPFTIEIKGITPEDENVLIAIYNMLGDKVYFAKINSQDETTLRLKPEVQLPSGVYLVEVQSGDKLLREKFIVQ